MQDIKSYLSVPGTRTQFQTAGADDSGKIKFEMKNFYNDGDIIAQTNYEKDSGYRLDIEQPYVSDFSQKYYRPLILPGKMMSY